MSKVTASKKSLLLFVFSLFLFSKLLGQVVDKDIQKKYILKDTLTIYKTGAVLLFTDSTFISFGILHDQEKLDIYVWYQTGKWRNSSQSVVFETNEKAMREDEMKKLIRQYYKKHPDHQLIDNYYEFVHEKYRNGRLTFNDGTLVDNDRQVNFITIKP